MYLTFKAWRSKFKSDLGKIYDERESENIFYLVGNLEFDRSRADILLSLNQEVTADVHVRLMDVLDQLVGGKPVQYILGKVFFFGQVYQVNDHVLIPRPETEELVQWVLDENEGKLSAVDIGTGSGCIGIEIARRRKDWSVTGIDVSEEALKLAATNSKSLSNIVFEQKDILEEEMTETFNIYISNPPYIPIHEKDEMLNRVTAYEPDLALYVQDEDPLRFYRRIMELVKETDRSGVKLYFEIHESFKSELELLATTFNWAEVEFRQDLQGKWRMLKCVS